MNINNQLGANSNVGQIDDKTKLKTTFVDKSIPTSNGPIANPNIKTMKTITKIIIKGLSQN